MAVESHVGKNVIKIVQNRVQAATKQFPECDHRYEWIKNVRS